VKLKLARCVNQPKCAIVVRRQLRLWVPAWKHLVISRKSRLLGILLGICAARPAGLNVTAKAQRRKGRESSRQTPRVPSCDGALGSQSKHHVATRQEISPRQSPLGERSGSTDLPTLCPSAHNSLTHIGSMAQVINCFGRDSPQAESKLSKILVAETILVSFLLLFHLKQEEEGGEDDGGR